MDGEAQCSVLNGVSTVVMVVRLVVSACAGVRGVLDFAASVPRFHTDRAVDQQ